MLKAEGRRLKARKAKSELSAAVLAALQQEVDRRERGARSARGLQQLGGPMDLAIPATLGMGLEPQPCDQVRGGGRVVGRVGGHEWVRVGIG